MSVRLVSSPHRPIPPPTLTRLLWRVERRIKFRVQVIKAAIYQHPHGRELRIFVEPEECHDVLHSELTAADVAPLEREPDDLRTVLIRRGWLDVQFTNEI